MVPTPTPRTRPQHRAGGPAALTPTRRRSPIPQSPPRATRWRPARGYRRSLAAPRIPQRPNAPTGAWCSLTQGRIVVHLPNESLNAPTGAWCSLTRRCAHSSGTSRSQCTYRCVVLPDLISEEEIMTVIMSQCTYRCVVLPDQRLLWRRRRPHECLNAPTGAWCSLTCYVTEWSTVEECLNAPTGAWCPLTRGCRYCRRPCRRSQCTYRCVVPPDPCPRERRYDATSRARSATGPGSTPPDRPAPGPE